MRIPSPNTAEVAAPEATDRRRLKQADCTRGRKRSAISSHRAQFMCPAAYPLALAAKGARSPFPGGHLLAISESDKV